MRDVLALMWERLKIIAAIIGDVQGRLIAILFYFTILVPFGIGSRLLSDPLRLRLAPNSKYWLNRPPVENALEAASRQG